MNRFRFCGDGLFVAGCAAYALNRLVLAPWIDTPFLRGHFNDFWLIPCALPPVLWLHQCLGWRGFEPPSMTEILTHLLLWSVLFEGIGPRFVPHATADPMDVLAYGAGGIAAWAWWHRDGLLRRPESA